MLFSSVCALPFALLSLPNYLLERLDDHRITYLPNNFQYAPPTPLIDEFALPWRICGNVPNGNFDPHKNISLGPRGQLQEDERCRISFSSELFMARKLSPFYWNTSVSCQNAVPSLAAFRSIKRYKSKYK